MAIRDEHDLALAAVRSRMVDAGTALAKAARGRLVRWGVGLDPDAPPATAWWARAHLMLGRSVRTLTIEGYASGPDAAEALADRVSEIMRARAERHAGRRG